MIFGGLVYIKSGSGTVVLIAVSIFLLFFDAILHKLEAYCHQNGFKGLVEKLIREFMVMGLLSFGTYIATESFDVSTSEWLHAFDFAHIIVLFVALAFVFQALGLILVVNSKNKVLLKFSAASCEYLLHEYEVLENDGGWKWYFFHHGPISLSYPDIRGNIEYKIMEGFFIKTFNLPPEFNFAHYMNRTLKKYVISLVEVRPINWLIFSVLVIFNYIRIQVLYDKHTGALCDYPAMVDASAASGHSIVIANDNEHIHMMGGSTISNPTDSHYSSELKAECTDFLLSYVFFCLQGIVVYVCVLLVFSELYMLRLLGKVTDAEHQEELAQSSQKTEHANQMLNQMHSLFAEWDYDSGPPQSPQAGSNSSLGNPSRGRAESVGNNGREQQNESLNADVEAPPLPAINGEDLSLNDALSSSEDEDDANKIEAMEDNLKSRLQVFPQQRPRHRLVVDANDEATKPPPARRKKWFRLSFANIGRRYMYARCLHRMWLVERALASDAENGNVSEVTRDQRDRSNSVSSTRKRSNSTGSMHAEELLSHAKDIAQAQIRSTSEKNGRGRSGSVFFEIEQSMSSRSNRYAHLYSHDGGEVIGDPDEKRDVDSVGGWSTAVQQWAINLLPHLIAAAKIAKRYWKRFIRFLMDHHGDPPRRKKMADLSIAEKQRDLSSIFLFSKPLAYYHAVEFAMLSQCIYLAFWLTNICEIAAESSRPVLWQFALIVPVIFNLFVLRLVLFHACILKSMSALDGKIADEITEMAIDERIVTHRLRKTIRGKLHDTDLERKQWPNFLALQFATFTSDGREGIDARTFGTFLHSLQICLTRKSVERLFKVIDFDADGYITWSDISGVVFPEISRRHGSKGNNGRNSSIDKHTHARALARLSTVVSVDGKDTDNAFGNAIASVRSSFGNINFADVDNESLNDVTSRPRRDTPLGNRGVTSLDDSDSSSSSSDNDDPNNDSDSDASDASSRLSGTDLTDNSDSNTASVDVVYSRARRSLTLQSHQSTRSIGSQSSHAYDQDYIAPLPPTREKSSTIRSSGSSRALVDNRLLKSPSGSTFTQSPRTPSPSSRVGVNELAVVSPTTFDSKRNVSICEDNATIANASRSPISPQVEDPTDDSRTLEANAASDNIAPATTVQGTTNVSDIDAVMLDI